MQKSVFSVEVKSIHSFKVECCKRNFKDIWKGLKELQFIKLLKEKITKERRSLPDY